MKKTIKKVANVVLGCITAAAFLCFATESDYERLLEAEIFHACSLAVMLIAGFGFYKTLDPETLKSNDPMDII